MRVSAFEIYLFRLTQIFAFVLLPFVYGFSLLLALLLGSLVIIAFVVVAIAVSPLLFAFMILDMASDFSSRSRSSHFAKYMDILVFAPDVFWDTFRKIKQFLFSFCKNLWLYARE
jgi:hypothetical protein